MTRRIVVNDKKNSAFPLYAIVDDEDYENLNQFTWGAKYDGDRIYATTNVRIMEGPSNGGKAYRGMTMHKMITGFDKTDHINRLGLDNRKENLRETNQSNNCANGKVRKGSSQYKGVCANKNRWKAQICQDNKRIYLGLFDTEKDAAIAYDNAAREKFGEFARINFPNNNERGV